MRYQTFMPPTLDDGKLRGWDSMGYFPAIFHRDEIILISMYQKRWDSYMLPLEIIHRMDICQIVLNSYTPF